MNPKARLLLVEDEEGLRDLMRLHLKSEGYEVIECASAEQAIVIAEQANFDLALLDWMLPGISGLETCRRFSNHMRVLLVTARSTPADIVMGLEAGADDYIAKPFEISVFLARVRALLRRAEKSKILEQKGDKQISLKNLRVNILNYEVTCGDRQIPLTPTEFKLLVALLENQGRVLSREALIRSVQGQGIVVVGRTVDTHVLSLRKKLGECADSIETIRGVGYRIKI